MGHKEAVTTTWPRQAQRVKPTYLKHKTHHNPILLLFVSWLAKTGGASEEARADEESGIEYKSVGAPDFPSGSAFGSFRKRLNPWNVVFDKFGSGKTDDAINALRESRDTLLNANARENCVLSYPVVVYLCRAEETTVITYLQPKSNMHNTVDNFVLI